MFKKMLIYRERNCTYVIIYFFVTKLGKKVSCANYNKKMKLKETLR